MRRLFHSYTISLLLLNFKAERVYFCTLHSTQWNILSKLKHIVFSVWYVYTIIHVYRDTCVVLMYYILYMYITCSAYVKMYF